MPIVYLGNPCPKNTYAGLGEPCVCCGRMDLRHEPVQGPLVTVWGVPDDEPGSSGHYSLLDCVKSICDPDGTWQSHTWDDMPQPLWVASTSAALQALLADQLGCPQGRPDDFVAANEQPAVDQAAATEADAEAFAADLPDTAEGA